ncbi:hypothetical protein D3C72_2265580 [compost metagenome]
MVLIPASQSAMPLVKSASNTPMRETSSASLRRRDMRLSASSEAFRPVMSVSVPMMRTGWPAAFHSTQAPRHSIHIQWPCLCRSR